MRGIFVRFFHLLFHFLQKIIFLLMLEFCFQDMTKLNYFFKEPLSLVAHAFNLALERHRQSDFCEVEASLFDRANSRSVRAI